MWPLGQSWPPQGAATQAAAAPTAHRNRRGLQVLFGDPVLECVCEPFTASRNDSVVFGAKSW